MLPRLPLVLALAALAPAAASPYARAASPYAAPASPYAEVVQFGQASPDDADGRLILAAAQQGYLGVTVHDIDTARAEKLKLASALGAEVVSLDHDAPAAKAGVHTGDVIQALNEQPVPDAATLGRLLRDMPVGKPVDLQIVHSGRIQILHLQLADRTALVQHAWAHHFRVPVPEPTPMVQGFAAEHSYYSGSPAPGTTGGDAPDPQAYVGAQVEPMTAQLAHFFGVHAGNGLLVRSVEDRSPAANAGIEAGDVILSANGMDLTSTADWLQVLRANAGHPVQIAVLRNRKVLSLAITVDARITQSELVLPETLRKLRQSFCRYSL